MKQKTYIKWSKLENKHLQKKITQHLDKYHTYLNTIHKDTSPYLAIVRKLLITQTITPESITAHNVETFLQQLDTHTQRHTLILYISRLRKWLRWIGKDFADYIQAPNVPTRPPIDHTTTPPPIRSQQQKELKHYLNHLRTFNRTEKTIQTSQSVISIFHTLTQKTITTLTEPDITHFIEQLHQRNPSPSSINTYIRITRLFLKYHDIDHLYKRIPSLKTPKPIKRRAPYDHIQQLLHASNNPSYHPFLYPILSLITLTGIRIGTILKLTIDNVDLNNRWITFWTKGQKEQPLPLHKQLIPILTDYIQSHNPSYYLFPNNPNDPTKHLNYEKLTHSLRKLSHNTDLPYYNPHAYRRAIATYLFYESEENLLFVSKFLNHENVQTTALYIDIDWDSFQDTYDSLTDKLTTTLFPHPQPTTQLL